VGDAKRSVSDAVPRQLYDAHRNQPGGHQLRGQERAEARHAHPHQEDAEEPLVPESVPECGHECGEEPRQPTLEAGALPEQPLELGARQLRGPLAVVVLYVSQ
jgi:hypothetical protein